MVKMNKDLCERLGGKWYDHNEAYGYNACVGIDLSEANLPNAKFYKSKLWFANFSNAYLNSTNFSKAYLWGADFSEASLFEADLSGSDLKLVKLNEKAVKSLLKTEPYYDEEYKKQVEKNKELIKRELLLSGV